MNCPDPITLSMLFDDALPEREAIDAHVAACPRCRALLDDFANVRRAMSEGKPRERSGDLAGVLARTRRRPLLRAIAVPLPLLIVILVIAFVVTRQPNTERGVLAPYDGGGRAVVYVGGR